MAYGIEVFNSSGVKVLELSNRVAHFVVTGSITVAAGATSNVTVSGLQNNDSWLVIISDDEDNTSYLPYTITKYSGYFSIYNQAGISITYFYWVLKS